MTFCRFIHCMIWLLCFNHFGFCQGDGWETPLVLTKQDGLFRITIPKRFEPHDHTGIAYFQAPEHGKTFIFCNQFKNPFKPSVLHIVEEIQPNEEFDDSKKCEFSAKSVLWKLDGPQNWHESFWNTEFLEFYYSGYPIQTEIIYENPETEEWHPTNTKNFHFFSIIEVYYYKIIEQTIAVGYSLVSTNLPNIKTIFNTGVLPLLDTNEETRINIFRYAFFSDPKYVEIFKGQISQQWLTTLSDQSNENPLSYILFATAEHFPLMIWKQMCHFSKNVIPIWKKPKLTWNKVEMFSRIVAKHLGELEVSVGITGVMTLSNQEVVDKYGFQLPKYLWKAFELIENGNNYGIIVVLNYNPFEKTEKKICQDEIRCEENGWIIANDDYSTGEIYCCAMTKRNIENLDVQFLRLKERDVFDLNKWELEKDIKLEYMSESATLNTVQ